MSDKKSLQELKELAKEQSILYVEDNHGLREKALQLFKKFFAKVVTAENGKEALEIFKELQPKIVVTDIRMPIMDGLEMSRRIKKISPHTKIIITSAFDDSEYLHESIKIGIYRYLNKPLKVDQLTSVLIDSLKQLKLEDEDQMFDFYVKNIFHNQNNLLILYHDENPVIVNNTLLNFFEVEDLEDFVSKYDSLGSRFLQHKSFLYNHESINWFEEALNHPNRLYHVKMHDTKEIVHHFVFKMIPLEGKTGYFLISMDDITELGLLKLFDDKTSRKDATEQDKKAILDLLATVEKNNSEIKMQNLYKGLTLTNKGIISSATKEKVELQSNYLQQKGSQHEGKIVISSEFFPFYILCKSIKNVNFDEQTIEVDDLVFMETSSMQRVSIRLEPDEHYKASLFYHGHKFGDGVTVKDISLEAVKLSMLSIPAGFKVDDDAHVDIVFTVNKKHLIINSEAKVLRIEDTKRQFSVVLMLNMSDTVKKTLISYLSHRQMELIREFKGLQYA